MRSFRLDELTANAVGQRFLHAVHAQECFSTSTRSVFHCLGQAISEGATQMKQST